MTRKKLIGGIVGLLLSLLAGLVQWWQQPAEKSVPQQAIPDGVQKVVIQKNSGGTNYQIDTTAPVYFTSPDTRSQAETASSKPAKAPAPIGNQKPPPKNITIDQKILGGEGNVNSVEVH